LYGNIGQKFLTDTLYDRNNVSSSIVSYFNLALVFVPLALTGKVVDVVFPPHPEKKNIIAHKTSILSRVHNIKRVYIMNS